MRGIHSPRISRIFAYIILEKSYGLYKIRADPRDTWR